MRKKQNIDIELAALKEVVRRNKIKNTGERIDDMVSVLMKKGIKLRSPRLN